MATMIGIDEAEALGAEAFEAGAMRVVPRALIVQEDAQEVGVASMEAAKAWYRGWDKANLAAPVDFDAMVTTLVLDPAAVFA